MIFPISFNYLSSIVLDILDEMTEEERTERRRYREMRKRTKAFLPKVWIFPLRINMVMPHREDKSVRLALNSLLKKIKKDPNTLEFDKKASQGENIQAASDA